MPNFVFLAFSIDEICVFIQTDRQYSLFFAIFKKKKKRRQTSEVKLWSRKHRVDYGVIAVPNANANANRLSPVWAGRGGVNV